MKDLFALAATIGLIARMRSGTQDHSIAVRAYDMADELWNEKQNREVIHE